MPTYSRLTYIQKLYFQQHGEQPTQIPIPPFVLSNIQSEEQLYIRRMKVTSEWKEIDLGWVDLVTSPFLAVFNREGTNLQLIPSPQEEAERAAEHTLYLGYKKNVEASMTVPPRAVVPVYPNGKATSLWVRSGSDSNPTQITVYAIPGE